MGAICDPAPTPGLTPALTATTGIDAIAHCIAGATWAQSAWGLSNPQQHFDILDASVEIMAREAELGHLLARE